MSMTCNFVFKSIVFILIIAISCINLNHAIIACKYIDVKNIKPNTKCTINNIEIKVIKLLGRGSFGKVMEVECRKLETNSQTSTAPALTAAVKFVSMKDVDSKETFVTEASIFNTLSTYEIPNIAQIYWNITDIDFYPDVQTMAIGMEKYYTDAQEAALNFTILQPTNVVDVMMFVSKLAHEMSKTLDIMNNVANITLKDIKPANIMINDASMDHGAPILDFKLKIKNVKFFLIDFGLSDAFKSSNDVCKLKGSRFQLPHLLWSWMQEQKKYGRIHNWNAQLLAVNWDMYSLYMTILDIILNMSKLVKRDAWYLPLRTNVHPMPPNQEIICNPMRYQHAKNQYFIYIRGQCAVHTHEPSQAQGKREICDILSHLENLIYCPTDVEFAPKILSWKSEQLFWQTMLQKLSFINYGHNIFKGNNYVDTSNVYGYKTPALNDHYSNKNPKQGVKLFHSAIEKEEDMNSPHCDLSCHKTRSSAVNNKKTQQKEKGRSLCC